MHYLSFGWRRMREWLDTPLGVNLLTGLQAGLTPLVSKMYGYRLLVVGEPGFATTIDPNFIKHRFLLHPYSEQAEGFLAVDSRLDMLAIACDSIDIVYLPHTLEFAQNPHEVLREAYRVLAPEGHLVIAGFNPISIWGLVRIFARLTQRAPWVANTVGVNKLKDWLSLLGFDIDKTSYYGFNIPINNAKFLSKTKVFDNIVSGIDLPICNNYILTAQKRVLPLTPIKPKFETARNFVPTGIIETSKIKY